MRTETQLLERFAQIQKVASKRHAELLNEYITLTRKMIGEHHGENDSIPYEYHDHPLMPQVRRFIDKLSILRTAMIQAKRRMQNELTKAQNIEGKVKTTRAHLIRVMQDSPHFKTANQNKYTRITEKGTISHGDFNKGDEYYIDETKKEILVVFNNGYSINLSY